MEKMDTNAESLRRFEISDGRRRENAPNPKRRQGRADLSDFKGTESSNSDQSEPDAVLLQESRDSDGYLTQTEAIRRRGRAGSTSSLNHGNQGNHGNRDSASSNRSSCDSGYPSSNRTSTESVPPGSFARLSTDSSGFPDEPTRGSRGSTTWGHAENDGGTKTTIDEENGTRDEEQSCSAEEQEPKEDSNGSLSSRTSSPSSEDYHADVSQCNSLGESVDTAELKMDCRMENKEVKNEKVPRQVNTHSLVTVRNTGENQSVLPGSTSTSSDDPCDSSDSASRAQSRDQAGRSGTTLCLHVSTDSDERGSSCA